MTCIVVHAITRRRVGPTFKSAQDAEDYISYELMSEQYVVQVRKRSR